MKEEIAVIGGDGIGPEVVDSAVELLRYLEPDLVFNYFEAGDGAAREGEALPPATLEAAKESDAVLLGACGETAADVIIRLRKELNTFVNLRPVKSLNGVDSVYDDLDITIVRENTEGLYKGIEEEISPGVTTATRVITERASERIARFAFEYAEDNGYEKVTVVHKSNVLRETCGLFSEVARQVGRDYDPDCEELLVDAAALHLVGDPKRFDVILTTNLFGDILSDLGGGLIGGLGLCPSANIGGENGIFEPVHGTAPDISGEGVANPIAAILSSSHLLSFLGRKDSAEKLEAAVEDAVARGKTTPDLGGSLTTEGLTSAIKGRLGRGD